MVRKRDVDLTEHFTRVALVIVHVKTAVYLVSEVFEVVPQTTGIFKLHAAADEAI